MIEIHQTAIALLSTSLLQSDELCILFKLEFQLNLTILISVWESAVILQTSLILTNSKSSNGLILSLILYGYAKFFVIYFHFYCLLK